MGRNQFGDLIDLDPDPHSINPDPYHWLIGCCFSVSDAVSVRSILFSPSNPDPHIKLVRSRFGKNSDETKIGRYFKSSNMKILSISIFFSATTYVYFDLKKANFWNQVQVFDLRW